MKALLDESQLLVTLRRVLPQAQVFQAATALLTSSGLKLLMGEISACLAHGGSGEILIGVDMPTDPEAIQSLLSLQGKHPKTFVIKRFNSGSANIFHPKLWILTLKSGQRIAIVGSSNFTRGGLLANHEANILIDVRRSVSHVSDHFDEHFSGGRAELIDNEWLESYRAIYKARKRLETALQELRKKVQKLDDIASAKKPIPRRITGHSFAFTGKIPGWPRTAKLYPAVKRLGGKPVKYVSGIKFAECLVHGDIMGGRSSTKKLREARRLGVSVINQDQFLRILDKGK